MALEVMDYDRSEHRGPRAGTARAWAWGVVAVASLIALPFVAGRPAGAVGRPAAATCSGPTYTVVAGDSWWKIATNNGVSMTALLTANNATTSTIIHPGDVLCLPSPGATPTTTVPPTTRPPATGGLSIRQFPVQGTCWFTDTYGAPRSGGRSHEGVDIIAASGRLIYAVDDGTLTKQYIDAPGALAGNGWRLMRADGTYFFYAHLSTFATGLRVGSVVKAGQILGAVGMTGNAGTPHLHFEVHPSGGSAVNPTAVVRAVDGCGTTAVPPQPGTPPSTSTPTTASSTTVPPTTAPRTTVPPTAPPTTRPPTTVPPTTVPATTSTTPVPPSTVPPNTTPPGVGPDARWRFVAPVLSFDTNGRPLTPGATRAIAATSLTGVPASATGVMVRLAVRNATSGGYLTVHACDTGVPAASTLTIVPGRANATMTVVRVVAQEICLTGNTAAEVRVEVVAFVTTYGVGVEPMSARRAVDTRTGRQLAAGTLLTVTRASLGAPRGAAAVTATVTLLSPAAAGSIGIGPCGGTPWVVAYSTAQAQVFSGVVRTNDAGVCITSTTAVHVVVDISGVWHGTTPLLPTGPQRLFDSRTTGAITTAITTIRPTLAAGSTRAMLTVTVVPGASPGALYVWNCAGARPAASVVSTAGGGTSATVLLDVSTGSICMASTGSVHAIVDLVAAG
ncbi:MAG: LysM peptidoglycan-binding domain-containing M23 family metallopeptidase [Actinomycetota bacterium]|nr:LysM peptidoglycan-binding domain-containing M23 family metallopeptidase [Actinomycetota bacterium]